MEGDGNIVLIFVNAWIKELAEGLTPEQLKNVYLNVELTH